MKKCVCENCNGQLKHIGNNKYLCEYCGTEYIDDSTKMVYVREYVPQCRTLMAKTAIETERIKIMGPELTSKQAIDCLAHKLAEAMKEYLEIETDYDFAAMNQIITARVRVVDPEYRFGY